MGKSHSPIDLRLTKEKLFVRVDRVKLWSLDIPFQQTQSFLRNKNQMSVFEDLQISEQPEWECISAYSSWTLAKTFVSFLLNVSVWSVGFL